MPKRVCGSVAALFCVLALSTPVLAQTTGNVRGRLADPDGQPLPGATVTIRSDALIEGSRSMPTGAN
ncbi:carboxypeptidase-like regulatory domain-containing protein, partial [Nitrospiraceae bacterium AH_259_D15_M11_P09]|nr:carboxypeptidase-like regulatory domain-containing protein [Nitrospiraceae bacterium AH_259_D15_M11_P09]